MSSEEGWNNYVELGFWVDVMILVLLMVISLGKLVNGIVDNMVVVVYLFVRCLVFFVFVMDVDMWYYFSI